MMFPRLTKSYETRSQPVASIRSSILRVVVNAIEAKGLSTQDLLTKYGLSQSVLDDPYNPVPLRNYVAFFEEAAECTGQPMLGIRLGEAIRPDDLGPVGVLYTMMQTLRIAIVRFSRFFPALQSDTRLAFQVDGDATWLEYQIEVPDIWPRRQDSEFTLALICALTRNQLGRGWAPEEIHFEHPAPRESRELSQFFGTVVRFGQPMNRMLIRNEDLARPFASAHPAAISIIEQHLTDLIGEGAVCTFEDAVSTAIMRCMQKGDVTLELVAARLGIGPRTLQRKLSAEGLSFRQVVQKQRHRTAEILLKNDSISLDAVAHSLGYADAATMSRAFRTWTGLSPRAFSRGKASAERREEDMDPHEEA